ncbi:hypothetical protein JTB14_010526 [Gonioctena quinquepunctata]|nr:hypothetical protein JTB14_010526 [Gonioctena quinquepunctata]
MPPPLLPQVIVQTEGQTDLSDDSYSSSSEEGNIDDLSTRKEEIQNKRNIKRRKTAKTHEEIELDRDIQEMKEKIGQSGKPQKTPAKPRDNIRKIKTE